MCERNQTHRAADLCATAGYGLSLPPVAISLADPRPSRAFDTGRPPSRPASQRRGEADSRGDLVAYLNPGGGGRCALIKCYARLTECRARKRRGSCRALSSIVPRHFSFRAAVSLSRNSAINLTGFKADFCEIKNLHLPILGFAFPHLVALQCETTPGCQLFDYIPATSSIPTTALGM